VSKQVKGKIIKLIVMNEFYDNITFPSSLEKRFAVNKKVKLGKNNYTSQTNLTNYLNEKYNIKYANKPQELFLEEIYNFGYDSDINNMAR